MLTTDPLLRCRSSTFPLALALLAAGCAGEVPAPTAYTPFSDKGGQFVCDAPKGWEVDAGGRPDSPNSFAKFSKGAALISVKSDLAGSLYGDMAKSVGSGLGGEAEHPSARVHEMGIRRMKEEFSNYNEREPVVVKSQGLGEGRRATFIADQSMGGKVYGYRATFLGGDRRIEVICTCPATNWKALKPAFEQVIVGLRR
jgi:hypothetical protein